MTDDASPDTPRRIAIVSDLKGLHAAVRAWVAELNVSRATIDGIAGLTDGHASKLLAPKPLKYFGPVSLGLMLEAAGLDLWVVVNAEKLGRVRSRLVKRRRLPSQATDEVLVARQVTRRELAAWGRAGGTARGQLPKEQLSEIGRKANRARWDRRNNNQPG